MNTYEEEKDRNKDEQMVKERKMKKRKGKNNKGKRRKERRKEIRMFGEPNKRKRTEK